jgi:methionyl-tRNA synthetase
MVERYREGSLPAGELDPGLSEGLATAVSAADAAIDRLDFQAALVAIMGFVRSVNGYVTEREPWKLAKDPANSDALDDVLYSTADALRAAAVLLNSFMPKACHLLWESLGAPSELADARIGSVTTDHLPAGVTVRKGPILFPRLES